MQRSITPIAIAAALSFAAYAAFVQFAPFTMPEVQNQIDSNMMRAQNFLASNPETALVGSSLTYRLPSDVLGPNISNIGMVGGSSLTGLSIIDGSGQRPKLVLVEINLLDRPLDREAVQAQLRFPERTLRKYFRVFRTGYDPANLLWRALMHFSRHADTVMTPEAMRNFYLGQQQIRLHPPEPVNFKRHLEQIAAMITSLKAKNVRVGFFEMPIDPGLTNLPGDIAVRHDVAQAFPLSRYCWLHLAVPGGAHTLDGVHLTEGDAAIIARQVVEQQKKCL